MSKRQQNIERRAAAELRPAGVTKAPRKEIPRLMKQGIITSILPAAGNSTAAFGEQPDLRAAAAGPQDPAPVAFNAPTLVPRQPQSDEEDSQYADGDDDMKELGQK
jgi:hypothetical protein